MNIGQASKASGVSAKMIRYYEEIGLVTPAGRSSSNYREFEDRELNELRFIRRARNLGFPVAEVSQLLSLWRHERPSSEVKALAGNRIVELNARIAALREMVDAIGALATSCAGDHRPDCPILETLAGKGT